MFNRSPSFYLITMCFVTIIGENSSQKLPVMNSVFDLYQSTVKHALLAWQQLESGIIDEKQMVEVVGRIALVKYFFEQAEENEQKEINSDSRFWTHVMDHILVHVYQAELTTYFRCYMDETVSYVRKKCWASSSNNQ